MKRKILVMGLPSAGRLRQECDALVRRLASIEADQARLQHEFVVHREEAAARLEASEASFVQLKMARDELARQHAQASANLQTAESQLQAERVRADAHETASRLLAAKIEELRSKPITTVLRVARRRLKAKFQEQ